MGMQPLLYNATLVGREDHTEQLSTFVVQYDEPLEKSPPYIAGQYVAIGLNNEDVPDKGPVRRSMSIASAPVDSDKISFYIRYVSSPESDNPLTHLLWNMKINDRIFMTRKPVGKFTLPATVGEPAQDSHFKKIVMVAAGTGLAPFLGMVRHARALDPSCSMEKTVLLHGASYPDDICYRDELSRASSENGLHYYGSVSRAKEAPTWNGNTGRVEDFFLPERLVQLEESTGITLAGKDTGVLICGLQGTIARCLERLAPRGFVPFDRKIRKALEIDVAVPASVWWEQYDTSPVIDLTDSAAITEMKNDLRAANAI